MAAAPRRHAACGGAARRRSPDADNAGEIALSAVAQKCARRSLLIGALLSLPAVVSRGEAVLRIARIADVPDQVVGSDILKIVYGRLGIAIEFVDVPGKRALALSSAGLLDGEVHRIAAVAQQYQSLLRVEPPINYIEPAVFTTDLNFPVQGWDSIRSYRIGIVRGVGSSEAGTHGMARVEAVTDLESLIHMLAADRFDLLVTDLFSGRVTLRKMRLEGRIHPLLPPLERIAIYHYLHERHAALVPKVAALLQEMAAAGELEQLRDRFVQEVLETS